MIVILLMLAAWPALAQQQPPDPAFMQRALGALQAQRNQAKAAGLADDLAKAQARIKELEGKQEEKK